MRQKTGSPAFLLRTDNDIEYTAGHPIITHRTFRAIPPSSPAAGYEAVLPSIWLSTDGRERARVIRGLSDSVLGSQPPPAADGDVLVLLLLESLHDLPSSFGGGLAWLRLLDVAFRALNLSS